jgi:hypothetical protein
MKWGMDMEKQNRKAMLAAYKERKVVGGVYSITNTITEEKHIYSTADLEGIKNRFKHSKTMGGCFNLILQKTWNEYGADAFELEILDSLELGETQTEKEFKDDLKTLEEMWLDKEAEPKSV